MTEVDNKAIRAIHRIEELYHETDGKCYISFSGGKDSTVILALVKMCIESYTLPKDGIKAVFCDTGIELKWTVEFVKWCRDNWYPNIEIIRPSKSFDWVLKKYGKPIRSKIKSEFIGRYQDGLRSDSVMRNLVYGVSNQGKPATRIKLADKDMHFLHEDFKIHASPECCTILKKTPFKKYAKEHGIKGYAYGIREGEGGVRSINFMQHAEREKPCTSISGGIIKKAPLIDWTDEDIEQFITKYNVPLSDAYTKYGYERTGCMGCPFSMEIGQNLEVLFREDKQRYKAAMHWLKDVYIAQNVKLPFDEAYEKERDRMWQENYIPMRNEMLIKYRPNSRIILDTAQMELDFETGGGNT